MKVFLTRCGNIITPASGAPALETIARSLFRICRYAGNCKRWWSVGSHSLLVGDLMPQELRVYGIMHDSEESVIGDPTRIAGNPELTVLKDGIRSRIFDSLNVPQPTEEVWKLVKRCDNDAILAELQLLMPPLPGWSAEQKLVRQKYGQEEPSEAALRLLDFYLNRWTVEECVNGDAPWKEFALQVGRAVELLRNPNQ